MKKYNFHDQPSVLEHKTRFWPRGHPGSCRLGVVERDRRVPPKPGKKVVGQRAGARWDTQAPPGHSSHSHCLEVRRRALCTKNELRTDEGRASAPFKVNRASPAPPEGARGPPLGRRRAACGLRRVRRWRQAGTRAPAALPELWVVTGSAAAQESRGLPPRCRWRWTEGAGWAPGAGPPSSADRNLRSSQKPKGRSPARGTSSGLNVGGEKAEAGPPGPGQAL